MSPTVAAALDAEARTVVVVARTHARAVALMGRLVQACPSPRFKARWPELSLETQEDHVLLHSGKEVHVVAWDGCEDSAPHEQFVGLAPPMVVFFDGSTEPHPLDRAFTSGGAPWRP